jgi:hypothetical protein
MVNSSMKVDYIKRGDIQGVSRFVAAFPKTPPDFPARSFQILEKSWGFVEGYLFASATSLELIDLVVKQQNEV